MTSRFAILLTLLCVNQLTHAQIKTYYPGIKTHYPEQNSGSLIYGNATEQHHYAGENYYGGNSNSGSNYAQYKPAETYQGGSYNSDGSNYYVNPTRSPLVLDATAEFINRTRESMASGVCYKEVPTASLVHDSSTVARGNGTSPNMSKIQVCCEGYERNPHVYARCDPICHDDCPNGICTAPNTCVCIPGHVRNHEEKCISICPIGCGNGICDARGECQCKPGFRLDPVSRKFCEPHCDQPCQFGKCVAPNKCDCLDGYRLTAAGVCEPKCDNCDFGKCTAPGSCSCNSGYMKIGGICEPVCSKGCNKGRCVGPDQCECTSGFELDHTGTNCVAHCDQPCLNGVCDGHNRCTCNPGYIQDEIQRNVCQAHCPQGCPNGFCTSPNFCVCKPGYIKSGIKGRQTCIPV